MLLSPLSLHFNCLKTELMAVGTLSHCWSHDWRLVCSQNHIFILGLLLNYAATELSLLKIEFEERGVDFWVI